MRWSHPELGLVEPIKRAHQPQKVWKHLYDPAERWESLAPINPQRLHAEAVAAGCPPFQPSGVHAPFDWRVSRHLQRHHDAAYEPAYSSELAADGTRWAAKWSDGGRWVARTPNAVIGVVSMTPRARVVTAYRPLPPLPGVGWGEDDFQRQADYVFEKETGMEPAALQRLAQDLLRQAEKGATTVPDGWWLALSVAKGRSQVAQTPELRGPLDAAEAALARLDRELGDELVRGVDRDTLLDRLAEGFKEAEPEDAEHALSDIEDALLVLEVLDAHNEVGALLEKVSSLVAWTPADFAALARHAQQRQGTLGQTGAASAMWAAVDESLAGAEVRTTTPARRPTASLLDELVPRPSLLDRVAAWAGQGADATGTWLSAQLAGFDVRPPVPVMGGAKSTTGPWSVVGNLAPGARRLRAFAVDAEYPDGYEVTNWTVKPGAALWQLERPGQDVVIVLVSADGALPDGPLSELLNDARGRDDVVVATRRFTRPR